jgi:hypothetical protein
MNIKKSIIGAIILIIGILILIFPWKADGVEVIKIVPSLVIIVVGLRYFFRGLYPS